MTTNLEQTLSKIRCYVILAIILITYAGNSFADGSIPIKGFMDEVLQQISGNTSTYQLVFAPAAKSLYAGLMTMEVAFDTGVKILKDGGPMKVIGVLLVRIIVMLIWFAMIDDPSWIQSIVDQSKTLAGSAGGVSPSVTPSEIAGMGVNYFDAFMVKIKAAEFSFTDIKLVLFGLMVLVVGIAMMVLFALTGLMYFITQVEATFVLSVGILMLGFLGSDWTKQWGKSFLSYVVAVSVKVMVTLLLVGIIQTVTMSWSGKISGSGDDLGQLLNVAFFIVLGAMTLLFLVMNIPAMSAGIITGVSTAGIGGAIAAGTAVAMAGAALVAGAGAYANGVKNSLSKLGGGSDNGGGSGGGTPGTSGNSGGGSMAPDGAPQPQAPAPESASSEGAGGIESPTPEGGISGGSDGAVKDSGNAFKPQDSAQGRRDTRNSLGASAFEHMKRSEAATSVAPPSLDSKHVDI